MGLVFNEGQKREREKGEDGRIGSRKTLRCGMDEKNKNKTNKAVLGNAGHHGKEWFTFW